MLAKFIIQSFKVFIYLPGGHELTHWGRVTHICISNLTSIGSDNGLSPGRCQAIIWTSAGILLIGPLGTNFSEILIEIYTFSFKKIHLKMSSGKWRPFCLGFSVLRVETNCVLCRSCLPSHVCKVYARISSRCQPYRVATVPRRRRMPKSKTQFRGANRSWLHIDNLMEDSVVHQQLSYY